jgi:hypothetical protein
MQDGYNQQELIYSSGNRAMTLLGIYIRGFFSFFIWMSPTLVPALIAAALLWDKWLNLRTDGEKEEFHLDLLFFLLSCLFGGSDTD